MSTLERIQNGARAAKLDVEIDSPDRGVLRLWNAPVRRDLVGIIVIRDERVTYAELDGQIIAHDLRNFRIDRLSAVLRALERRQP